ncbi:MAG: hypothetical protein P8X57_11675 [Cyclobacteriaceae bacterium]
MPKLALTILLLSLPFCLAAQTEQEKIQEDIRQRQVQYKATLDRMIETGVDRMDEGDYIAADKIFRDVLKNSQVVPTDMTFFFGKNSFYLEKFEQSADWLNKYIQLKGTKGKHFEEATSLLNEATKAIRLLQQQNQQETKAILASSFEIDCGPSGKVVCPVCQGKTVIITKTAFGQNYRECPYCDDHGLLTCDQYNLLLKGKLEPN